MTETKTNLSAYIFPSDKNEFEKIVALEKERDQKRTVGDVFRDMVQAYKKINKIA